MKHRCINTCHGFRGAFWNEGDIVHVEPHEMKSSEIQCHFVPVGGKRSPVVEQELDEEDSEEESTPHVEAEEAPAPKPNYFGKKKGKPDVTKEPDSAA